MMEYRVWLYGATTYTVCEDTLSVRALVATSAGPCRVEVYQLALLRVDTYGLAGGPPLPKSLPFAKSEGSGQHLMSQTIMHVSLSLDTSLAKSEDKDTSLASTLGTPVLGGVQGVQGKSEDTSLAKSEESQQ